MIYIFFRNTEHDIETKVEGLNTKLYDKALNLANDPKERINLGIHVKKLYLRKLAYLL